MPAVDVKIQRMLELGIIEAEKEPYCNPIRVVTKKDGQVRVCFDARVLNNQIESDGESPPKMEELLQRFFGAKYFSTTDLVCGYWRRNRDHILPSCIDLDYINLERSHMG